MSQKELWKIENLGQLKKIPIFFLYSKKIFKVIKKFRMFFIFQGLIHEIKNVIVPRTLSYTIYVLYSYIISPTLN